MASSDPNPEFESAPYRPGQFAPTSWTAVTAAQAGGSEEASRALAKLCQDYWAPLHAYVRRLGKGPEEAMDLTQEFFYVLLSKNYLGAADRRKGKFRTFLLTALSRFLANDYQKSQAQKRGGGMQVISIDDDRDGEGAAVEPATDVSPLKLFEQRWAAAVLKGAMRQLKAEQTEAGKGQAFEVLKAFLDERTAPGGYADAAESLGMNTNSVRVTVHRLRQRLAELVRTEVARTMADPTREEIEEEVRHLFDAFEG